MFCYNIIRYECWCGSMAEQLICNQRVDGSTPFTSSIYMGEFPSGQRGQTVNLLSLTSLVRIQLPPPCKKHRSQGSVFFYILEVAPSSVLSLALASDAGSHIRLSYHCPLARQCEKQDISALGEYLATLIIFLLK